MRRSQPWVKLEGKYSRWRAPRVQRPAGRKEIGRFKKEQRPAGVSEAESRRRRLKVGNVSTWL